MVSAVRFTTLALLIAGCTVDDLAQEGRPCPCGPDTVCDPSSNTCVRSELDLGISPDGPVADRAADVPSFDGGLQLGETCAGAAQCKSGHCVDGVCCDAPCVALCKACNLDGMKGKCSFEPQGTSCAPAACHDSYTLAPEKTCDDKGHCQGAGGMMSCDPYLCDTPTAACLTSCADDNDCVGGYKCKDKKCLATNGSPCGADGECASGYCVDGGCCENACKGNCWSCAITGNVGTCILVPVGTDPDNECLATPASTCGTDGMCDGQGGCRLHAKMTICDAVCVSEFGEFKLDQVRGCSGKGSCNQPLSDIVCPGNFACDTTTDKCLTSCTSDSHCTGGWACDLSAYACFTKCLTGAQCKKGADCVNGKCDD